MIIQHSRNLPSSSSTSFSVKNSKSKKREDIQVDFVWENQRGTALLGAPRFSSKSLLPTDRDAWSDENGKFSLPKESIQLPDPEKWKWISEWMIDMTINCDPDGWQYAFNFGHFHWSSVPGFSSYVRRRRWKRVRQRIHVSSLTTTTTTTTTTPSSSSSSSLSRPMSSDSSTSLQLIPKPSMASTPSLLVGYRKNTMRLDRERLEYLSKELEAKKTITDLLGMEPELALIEILNLFDFELPKTFLIEMLMKSSPKDADWLFKLANDHLLFQADRSSIATTYQSLLPSIPTTSSSLTTSSTT